MYTYTDALFKFLLYLVKDNIKIKILLYEHSYVLFYFIHLNENASKVIVEMFKENKQVLFSLIRDCEVKSEFKTTLGNLNNLFGYKICNKEGKFNFFDLIFELIKISKYNETIHNSYEHAEESEKSKLVSLVRREILFSILKSTIEMKNSYNLLENQRYIVSKILKSSSQEIAEYQLVSYLDKSSYTDEFSPFLIDLFISVAENNPDRNIKKLMEQLFSLNYLFKEEKTPS